MKARQKGKQNSKWQADSILRKLAQETVRAAMDSLATRLTVKDKERVRAMIEEGEKLKR